MTKFSSKLQSIKKQFLTHKWKILAGLVLVVATSWRLITQAQSKQPQIQTINPEYQDLVKTLDLTGVIDAKNKARMRFLAGGKIAYLGAKEGDWIKQWQTIATIDARDLQKRLEKNLNLYMQQRWDWEDLTDNIKDQSLNLSERRYVDKQQWNLDNSVIDVELQDIAISNSVMTAPFDGVLIYSPVSTTHTQVTATDFFELIDPESLIFRAEVNEEDISSIHLHQPASITLDAYLEEDLPASISYISYQSSQTSTGTVFVIEFPLIESESVTTDLVTNLSNKQLNINLETASSNNKIRQNSAQLLEKYRLGMNGDAKIILEEKKDVLAIPLVATIYRDGKVFVEVLEEGETKTKEIQVGLETDEHLEVLSGLSKDDLVVLPQN